MDLRPIALVTGASKGIGAASAVELAKNGYFVIVNYNKSRERAESVVADILSQGGEAEARMADVSSEESVVEMFRYIKNTYGRLDVLVNNAGISADGFIMTMSLETWNKTLLNNLTSVFLCTREALKLMSNKKIKGRIVNISSVSGIVGMPGQSNYSATKGGIIAFTKSVSKEAAKYGITVNAIAPGFIETDMTKSMPKQTLNDIISDIPIKRMGAPLEIARMVTYLVCPDADYMTGKVMVIDGGMVM
jgi:3-oxoacyl-[acyl-carrier protein] reductase